MKHRVEQNVGAIPVGDIVVRQAMDGIKSESIFHLLIVHVLACRGHSIQKGFMPTIRYSEGSVCENGKVSFGTDETAYDQAIKEGEEILKRKVDEFLNPEE